MRLAFVLGLLVSRGAWAICAPASAALSPDSGFLPYRPTLFLFLPVGQAFPAIDIRDSAGLRVPFSVEAVSAGGAWLAWQLHVEVDREADLRVEVGRRVMRYAVRGNFSVPVRSAIDVVRREIRSYAWSCSVARTVELTLNAFAPAFEVEWAASLREWNEGRRHREVYPASTADLFLRAWGEPPRLSLGKMNCAGTTIDWSQTSRLVLQVRALEVDGSRSAASAMISVERPPEPQR